MIYRNTLTAKPSYPGSITIKFILLLLVLQVFGSTVASSQASPASNTSLNPQNAESIFAFSQNGNKLASAGGDKQITVLDVVSGQELATFPGYVNTVITGLAFSPDGKILASAAEAKITLWDMASGQEYATFSDSFNNPITDLAFSPESNKLAGIAGNDHIVVWDINSGSRQWVLSGDGAVSGISFSPDGALLASYGENERIKLWDIENGQEHLTLTNPLGSAVTDLVFSPVNMTLASVDRYANITLWNTVLGHTKNILTGHHDLINGLAFRPDGNILASGGMDAQIKLWNVETGQEQLALSSYFGMIITGLAFSPGGDMLASWGEDSSVMVWDVPTGELRQILDGNSDFVAGAAFSSNQQTLASVGNDGRVIVWDLANGMQRFTLQIPGFGLSNLGQRSTESGNITLTASNKSAEPTASVTDPAMVNESGPSPSLEIAASNKANKPNPHAWQGITGLATSPDGRFFGSSHEDSSVRLWDAAGEELLALPGHSGAATGVAFSTNGKFLVTAGRDTEVRSWDIITGKINRTLLAHEHPIRAIATSLNGNFFASAGEETRIMLWDAKTGKLNGIFSGHKDFINGLAFSSNGKYLASASADDRIILWDLAKGKRFKTLLGHSDEVNAVAFSQDNRVLASGGADTQVKLWDVATGQQILNLAGHQAPVRSVAMSPNGKTLVSAGEDTRIYVWDVATGKLLKALTGNTNFINALAFLPSGLLLAGDENNQIIQWDVEKAEKVKIIKPSKPVQADSSAETASAAPPTLSTLTPGGAFKDNSPTATKLPGGVSSGIFGRLLDWLLPAANAATLADPNQGPGGPILVINSVSSNFGNYYAEILRNEGFNAFAVTDITTVTPATLSTYDVVILAAIPLSPAQVTVLSDWVDSGGNLIAMRPDSDLANLLGISATGSTLSNGYLLVDTSQAPGNGIVSETIQFHGTADRYTLNGASELATLYTNATTATSNPALTLRSVGSNGGQAAAFTYDLATSIVYTRQGNPAWASQERDGFAPIRSDDKFYGNATGDPQPDWVDLDKVAIPQADEQQRLLVNLILEMNRNNKPLPRFWYFPRGEKAVVVMTGDDHGNNGTAPRFDQFIAASPAGCSLENWECVRGTSYIYPNTPLTNAQAAAYTAQGFEVGLHVNTNCADFTPASLESFYAQQISSFAGKYSSVPPPSTQRHHCIAWSDWVTGAKVQLNHGIRLDTTYYFWPPGWVLDRPGFFTGSGMPMRFSDLDGSLIDVYNVATQMTDESGQQYPFTVDTLLDRALGSEGYYGAFTINAHTDLAQIPESDTTVASALARSVPIVSSQQMLNWLDGRNSSSFESLAWNGSTLSFTVTPGAGANGLQALIPMASVAEVLNSVTHNGSTIAFTTEIIKGVQYAAFSATAGTYAATYATDSTVPTVTSKSPTDGATGVNAGTAVTATFSETMDAETVTNSTFELRDPSNTLVAANVSYESATKTARLTPAASLTFSTTFTATIKGGASGVKDLAGNALPADVTWSFTTATGPACPCNIWSSSTTPANPSVSDPNAVELGVKFKSDLDGFITGIRFYKGSGNTGTHTGNLWTGNGTLLATATFTNESSSGWQQVNFANPVAITADTVYVASYHAPNGGYAANNSYFNTSGVGTPPLQALQDGVSGGNGVYRYSASSAFPSSTYQASNYWVDVAFTTSMAPDTTPPTVTSQTPTDGASGISTATTVTATFSEALDGATVTTSTVELRDSGNTLVPATVAYNAATLTATLTPSSALNGAATYTATVKGGANGIKDVAGNALAADVNWTFTTAATDTTAPTVTGQTPTAGATGVSTGTTVTATFSEAMDASTVTTSTVELRDPSNTLVPATVAYNAATLTATLTPGSTLNGSATYTATVKGGANGVKDLAGNALANDVTWTFTTGTGPACPCSLWEGTVTPTVLADPDSSAIELGVKFRSEVAGYISGIRFYKSSQNTGTHVGNLWTTTGTLLATATFTNETGSGWQQVNFDTPVAIQANTVYVASYHTNVGRYSVDDGYFSASGIDTPPLRALQNGENGGNGVYVYSANPAFPTNTFNSSNYWVDVVFTTSVAPDTTPPTVTGQTPTAGATGVSTGTAVTATFSEAMDASTVTTSTVDLHDSGNTLVPASVTYDGATKTATLTPDSVLADSALYTATVKGGANGVKDLAGNALANDVTWTFTTGTGPACPCSLWEGTVTPTVLADPDSSAIELGVKFRSEVAGYISGIRFYKSSQNTGTHVGNLWTTTGTLLATATFTNETGSGWQQVSFDTPVAIQADTVYVASYHTNVGRYSVDDGYFSASGVDTPPLRALQNGENGGNGVYVYSANPAFPTNTFNSSNYWVDVIFVTSVNP